MSKAGGNGLGRQDKVALAGVDLLLGNPKRRERLPCGRWEPNTATSGRKLTRANLSSEATVMDDVELQQAQSQLSKLIDRVECGETLTLTRDGKPAARIVPIAERRPGLLKSRPDRHGARLRRDA